jgi:hypothetical protein
MKKMSMIYWKEDYFRLSQKSTHLPPAANFIASHRAALPRSAIPMEEFKIKGNATLRLRFGEPFKNYYRPMI